MGGHQSTQWKVIQNKNRQASPMRRLCWRGLKVKGTDLHFKQEGAYKWPPHLLWHSGRSQLFVSLTYAHAELPRWNGSRTRFQMVSDVAEGLPDGYSYIYASMYLCVAGPVPLALAPRPRRRSNYCLRWLLKGHSASWLDPRSAGHLTCGDSWQREGEGLGI